MAAAKLQELLATDVRTSARAHEIVTLLTNANIYNPSLILRFGELALSHHSSSTRPYWEIVSAIIRASADVGETEITSAYLKRLADRFPASARVHAVCGVVLEAKGEYEEATQLYMNILGKNTMERHVYKRQVALLKSDGRIVEAIAQLNFYLATFSDDADAWAELCALCMNVSRYEHALFAANELVLLDANNWCAHVTVADVCMTIGESANLIAARGHYATALRIRPAGNLRALYGLWLVCSQLMSSKALGETELPHTRALLEQARKGIHAVYAKVGDASVLCWVDRAVCGDITTVSKK